MAQTKAQPLTSRRAKRAALRTTKATRISVRLIPKRFRSMLLQLAGSNPETASQTQPLSHGCGRLRIRGRSEHPDWASSLGEAGHNRVLKDDDVS